VDAAALSGARVLRSGQDAAREEAETVARANGVGTGAAEGSNAVSFGTNARGESIVSVSATRVLPTTFMKVLGVDHMNVGATSTAAVPPLDVVLVLDTSGSLGSQGAWDELQDAAREFVRQFDDKLDQMGLISFQLAAHDRFTLRHNFKLDILAEIDAMASAGDTNIGEALRKAGDQLRSPTARANAAQVVVFFTDGRATAFRGHLGGPPALDRMIAVGTTGTNVRGYWNDPDALPAYSTVSPNGCQGVGTCFGLTGNQVRAQAAALGATHAQAIRQEGARLYVIALGNPSASDPLLTPDLDYLRGLANEEGITSANEPRGKLYFSPSAAQLEAVFKELASDLVVRLTG
jgi:Mg-chelatase subunit ChlD